MPVAMLQLLTRSEFVDFTPAPNLADWVLGLVLQFWLKPCPPDLCVVDYASFSQGCLARFVAALLHCNLASGSIVWWCTLQAFV